MSKNNKPGTHYFFCFHIDSYKYPRVLTNGIIPIIDLWFLLLIRIDEQVELSRYEGADTVVHSKLDGFCKGVKGSVACIQFHIAQFDCYDANIIAIVGVVV